MTFVDHMTVRIEYIGMHDEYCRTQCLNIAPCNVKMAYTVNRWNITNLCPSFKKNNKNVAF